MALLPELFQRLTQIDAQLDDIEDDLGDLPVQVRKAEEAVRERLRMYEETQALYDELERFKSNSGVVLQEIRDKETQYADQQFSVRNNREFDAITKEIDALRDRRSNIQEELRTIGVKEENLRAILEQQRLDYEEHRTVLEEKEEELKDLSGGHLELVQRLNRERLDLEMEFDKNVIADYNRIRTFHRDAAVPVRRNCCSGCYSAVPPQKLVEMRNNSERLFLCEHCGRLLFMEMQG